MPPGLPSCSFSSAPLLKKKQFFNGETGRGRGKSCFYRPCGLVRVGVEEKAERTGAAWKRKREEKGKERSTQMRQVLLFHPLQIVLPGMDSAASFSCTRLKYLPQRRPTSWSGSSSGVKGPGIWRMGEKLKKKTGDDPCLTHPDVVP